MKIHAYFFLCGILAMLLFGLSACKNVTCETMASKEEKTTETNKIKIIAGDHIINVTLEDNATARDFLSLLPLELTLEDYNKTEKVGNPGKKLTAEGAPSGYDPSVGDLCYYAPWGNLCVFYEDFGYSNGLIKLGTIDGDGVKSFQVPGSVKAKFERTISNENTNVNSPENNMVRLSIIKVDETRLKEYNALLKEEITASMDLEPGVLVLYAVAEKKDPSRITILEIYAGEAAYKSHIQTPHFKKYKEGTLDMVEELELIDTDPLIPGLKIKQ